MYKNFIFVSQWPDPCLVYKECWINSHRKYTWMNKLESRWMNEQKNGWIALRFWARGSEARGSIGIIDKCSSIHNNHLMHIKLWNAHSPVFQVCFQIPSPFLSSSKISALGKDSSPDKFRCWCKNLNLALFLCFLLERIWQGGSEDQGSSSQKCWF